VPVRAKVIRSDTKLALIATAAVIAVAFAPALHAQPRARSDAVSRIVVVPDVHGAYPELVGLLEATGIVDAALNWSGGDAHLVSLGDLLDRGAESRKVLDLLMRLQRDAPSRGGAVHVVLGNHELMNLIGDLRYVSRAEYAAYADEEPADFRAAAYERFIAEQPQPLDETDARAAFEQRYPPGYFGHRLAFAADGRYGSWLLSQPVLIVINETAFVHGGLSELVARTRMEDINRRIQDGLRRYLAIRDELADAGTLPRADMQDDIELAQSALSRVGDDAPEADRARASLLREFLALSAEPELGIDGPLWYRGSVYCNPFLEQPVLEAALEELDAERVVVGHTPTDNRRARELYDGRLIMLDTGMLTGYYAGRPAALVIEEGNASVQYLVPEERLLLERGRLEADGLTEAEILEALAQGEIEAAAGGSADPAEPRLVTVRHAGHVLRARFYSQTSGRATQLELAAHGLDRLLGLNVVPPTVARDLGGEAGALQLQYPDAITEADRIERNAPLEGWCPIDPQVLLMYAFDALTYNTGRTQDNIVYREESSVVKLIDHGRAFGTGRQLRLPAGIMLSPAVRERFESLDRRTLESALGAWLDERQIRALLARRDTLLRR
jgi:3',5'-cyclic AMP phosphodiesterase CpdA